MSVIAKINVLAKATNASTFQGRSNAAVRMDLKKTKKVKTIFNGLVVLYFTLSGGRVITFYMDSIYILSLVLLSIVCFSKFSEWYNNYSHTVGMCNNITTIQVIIPLLGCIIFTSFKTSSHRPH